MTRRSKELLKEEAKRVKVSMKDAKVLSTDPFFVGSDNEYEMAEWVARQWDRMMASRGSPIHLRGFHYWLQSTHTEWPSGEEYASVDPAADWSTLLWCAQMARYLGTGRFENLIDLKHPETVEFDEYYPVGTEWWRDGDENALDIIKEKLSTLTDDLLNEVLLHSPLIDIDGYQPYHLEVWVEKQSMGVFIEPIIQRLGATYQALVGQSSIEKVNLMFQRARRAAEAGKKTRIFYISDYDRYGWQMPIAVARKLEFYTRMTAGATDLDIRLKHIALTEEQIEKWGLPPAPKHGEMVVELDALEALHPGKLANIVKDELTPYIDKDNPKDVRVENQRMYEKLEEMLAGIKAGLGLALEEISLETVGDFKLDAVVDTEYVIPEPDFMADEGDDSDWLLDTTRSYWSQWGSYNEHKAGRVETASGEE